MELGKVIEDRRSIRNYLEKELDNKTIEDILNYGILAPSAKNRQPWHFIVIKENKELKNNIADQLYKKTGETGTLTCEAIKDCSALVLVFAEITDTVLDVQSVGACIENMLLRAHDQNVASLWIGYILEIEEELKKEFSTDKTLIAAVALGYSDKIPKARPRKTLADVTSWY